MLDYGVLPHTAPRALQYVILVPDFPSEIPKSLHSKKQLAPRVLDERYWTSPLPETEIGPRHWAKIFTGTLTFSLRWLEKLSHTSVTGA